MMLVTPTFQTLDSSKLDKDRMNSGHVSKQEASPQWSGLTPLQSAFAEAERCRQESERIPSWQYHLTKRPRVSCRRVPCKARGLSVNHNQETAFLEIPENAPHGKLLCCSHPDCARSGRRFRFCTVCEMPVAKRNFLKRHGHGVIRSTREIKDHELEDLDEDEDEVIQDPGEHGVDTLADDVANCLSRVVNSDLTRTAGDSENKTVTIDHVEQRWLELLKQRPETEDQTGMTDWMNKVITLSEGKKETPSAHQFKQNMPTPIPSMDQTSISPRRPTRQRISLLSTLAASIAKADSVADEVRVKLTEEQLVESLDRRLSVEGYTSRRVNEQVADFAAGLDDCDFSDVFDDDNDTEEDNDDDTEAL